MKKIVFGVIFILSLYDLGMAKKAAFNVGVGVAHISRGDLTQSQAFSGTVEFNEKSKLAAQSSGAITNIYFDRLQYVKKGLLLLKIDSKILKANINSTTSKLKEAQLKLELAEIDFKRYKVLLKKRSIARQKFDEFYYQKEQAKQSVLALSATLKSQLIALEKKSTYAAFDGVIIKRNIQVGEWLNAGEVVALLVNPRKIDIIFHLPTTYMNIIKAGINLDVEINKKTYTAKVIGNLLDGDANTRTFPLLLRLNSKENSFFEGMQAQLILKSSIGNESLLVPRDAIIRKYDKNVIFIIKDGSAKLINVYVKGFNGSMAAISAKGLKKGMQVVIKGNERLYPGAKVTIK